MAYLWELEENGNDNVKTSLILPKHGIYAITILCYMVTKVVRNVPAM